MTKDRVVALSDGIIAVIITIMVPEMRIPHGADLSVLRSVTPGSDFKGRIRPSCMPPRSDWRS